MSGNNIKRIFSDVVSVDSWHTPFDGLSGTATVHIDAVFGEARIGGDADAPIRFRLSLRRAEIVVVVPHSEPLQVQKGTVARSEASGQLNITRRTERSTSARAGVEAHVGISASKFPVVAAASAHSGLGMSQTDTEIVETDDQMGLVLATQNQTSDGYYRWECRPTLGSALRGRPWDAQLEPRLKIKDLRRDMKHLAGSLRIEVRCKREDLIIDDIQIKDQDLLSKIKNAALLSNKIVAVESYLKYILSHEKLEFSNISDPFGHLCLADVMVEESSE